jgi:GH24 family phage-related lysozyme (muramidase)
MKKKTITAIIAAALTIGAPLTLNFEGMELKPYYDSVGVKTVCAGETEDVQNRTYTKDECLDRFNLQYGFYSYGTARFYNATAQKVVTPPIHAAFTDMAYNLGLGTVCKSSMIRELNAGRPRQACQAILLYTRAGGKDCRVRSNNCYGIWERRKKIHDLCMKGLNDDL